MSPASTDQHAAADGSHTPVAHGTWYPGIEILRAIAALTVVLCHCYTLNPTQSPLSWLGWSLGSFGVLLFFLLSGFLLGDSFWGRKKPHRARNYWLRRFFRIAPAYYLCVGILFLFFAVHSLLFSMQGLRQVLANLTFTQYLFPITSSSLNVNGALWTLTIEFAFYLALPFIAIAFMRAPLTTFVVCCLLGAGYRIAVVEAPSFFWSLWGETGQPSDNIVLFMARQFLGFLPVFMLGIGAKWLFVNGHLRWLYQRLPTQISIWWIFVALVPPLLCGYFVFAGVDPKNKIAFVGYDYLVVVLFLPALLICAIPRGVTQGRMRDLFVWLGERSYGIYLWHFPIILSFYGIGPSVNDPTSSYRLLRMVGIITLSILAAAISYRAIEKPAQAFGRRLTQRDRIWHRNAATSESARTAVAVGESVG